MFIILVFSVFAIAALAASGRSEMDHITVSVSGTDGLFIDKADGKTEYNAGTHRHNGFDSYSHVDSCVYVETYGETDSGVNPFVVNQKLTYITGGNTMFHKKALKNTVTCFVLLTLVFSTLVVAVLAATATATSSNVDLTLSATRRPLISDIASASASYRPYTHTHDGMEAYTHRDSYMFIWINAYSSTGAPKFGADDIAYGSSSIDISYDTGFGWTMDSAAADATFYCGVCGYTNDVSGTVTAE